MSIYTIKVKWKESELKQNTHVIETHNGVILVDAGASMNELREITDKPVLAVLITHSHFDHILAIEEYDRAGIKIYCTKQQLKVMNNEKLNVTNIVKPYKYHVNNFVEIHDNQELEIDGAKIKCIFTPGHSHDSVCYLINGDLFSGDTVFSIAIGRTDFENSSNIDMIASLKKLNDLDFNNVYAGHGRMSNKQEQIKNIDYYINLLESRI